MRTAEQGALALTGRCDPVRAILEPAGRFPVAADRNKEFERRVRIRYDAGVGREHSPDLRGLDVDMHKLAALGVDIDRTGMPIGPAVADAKHEVGSKQRCVPVLMRSL